MTQKTATEKEIFLQMLGRELETTRKLLDAYPQDQPDLKPHERSKTAKELAWMFVLEQMVLIDSALKGKLEASQPPAAPARFGDVVAAFEKVSRETSGKIAQVRDEELERPIPFPVGPGKMGDVRRLDVLWLALLDQVHHRGQFSVYLRLAGGKVPSIYGPSADEPWN